MRSSSESPRTRRASTGQPLAPKPKTDSPSAPLAASTGPPPTQLPVKPTAPQAVARSRHLRLGIDATTGEPCVGFTGQAAHLNEKLKSALLARLKRLDEPLQGWPAANALIGLFIQFGVQPALGVALIEDEALWGRLCTAKADAARGATVAAALLRLGETGVAFQWLSARPRAADRRRVVRRLIKDEGQALLTLKANDLRNLFEAVFDDMLKHGLDSDEALRPAIEALRRSWRSERQDARSLAAVEAELVAQGVRIHLDPQGRLRLVLQEGTRAGPALTEAVLAYIAQALAHEDSRAQGLDALFEALRGLGLDCGDGRSVPLVTQARIAQFQRQCRSLAPEQTVALSVFIRRACTLLFATGEATAVESLIRASLWLKDPLIRTDPLYQAAARQAMVDQGWAGLWLMTQAYNPWKLSTTLFPVLLERLRQVASPGAALHFISDTLQFLADLGKSADLAHDGPHTATWREWRDDLMEGLIHAIGGLIKRSAQWPSDEGAALAQWAWVAGAAMALVHAAHEGLRPEAEDLLRFGPCLTHFQAQGKPLARPIALTLKLLGCDVSPAKTAYLTLERMRDLFRRCPIEIQSVVLHWPVGRLWAGALWRAIEAREVLHPGLLNPAVRLLVLQDLLNDRKLLPLGLGATLSALLPQAGFDRLVAVLQTRPEMTPQARQTLLAVCDRTPDAAHWRPGLPALLRWLQETADRSSAEGSRQLFEFLAEGIVRLRATRGASDKDLLDIGAQLQLSATPAMAALQLDTLIASIQNPQITAPVLRGWIWHCVRHRQTVAPLSPADIRVLKSVLACYRRLLSELDHGKRRMQWENEWSYLDQMRRGMKK